MKTIIMILGFGFALTGCGLLHRQTVHEYCMENLSRFKDYDECREDKTAELNRKAYVKARPIFPGLGESRPLNCYSNTNGATTYTNCN